MLCRGVQRAGFVDTVSSSPSEASRTTGVEARFDRWRARRSFAVLGRGLCRAAGCLAAAERRDSTARGLAPAPMGGLSSWASRPARALL